MSRNVRNNAMMRAVITGASPSDGSSSISSDGRATSARPSASICRSPPESWCAVIVTSLCERLEQFVHLLDRTGGLARAAGPAPPQPPRRRLSSTVSSAMTPRPSGTCATPRVTSRSTGSLIRSRPSNRTVPVLGLSSPDNERSKVVLPAPLAPSTTVIVAGSRTRSMSCRTATCPYPHDSPRTSSSALIPTSPPRRCCRDRSTSLRRVRMAPRYRDRRWRPRDRPAPRRGFRPPPGGRSRAR